MTEPNRWTQAMALEVGVRLDHSKLNTAFTLLAGENPMLSARFFRNELQEWQFITNQTDQQVFMHDTNNYHSWSERGSAVHEAYQRLESQLDIHTGQLCRATLIDFKDGPSILVMVAHHLVVDIITWRLLLDDLMRHYATCSGLESSTRALSISQFDEWCNHLRSEKESLYGDVHYWKSQPEAEATALHAGQEEDSRTVWLALSEQESSHINLLAAEQWNSTLDRYLLAAYLEEVACFKGKSVISVDIESHGRLSIHPNIDISRTAGWFTSIFPLTFDVSDNTSDALVASVQDKLSTLPHLGTAYELLQIQSEAPSALCFNYVGQFRLGMRNDWRLTPVDVLLPSLRGLKNNRVHELKLTGRIYKQQLLLDINFNNKQYSDENMLEFARRLRARLLRHMPVKEVETIEPVVDSGNSAGAIWNPLPALLTRTDQQQRRQYQHVLLTGVTGFIGIHALEQLLEQTTASIYCLIRPRPGATVEQRLQEAWQAFFDVDELQNYKARVHCIPADLTQSNLGLTSLSWDFLSHSIDAIYHFAADTKLVGSGDKARDNIVAPVEGCILLAERGRHKDLHFMSTLAVSGTREGKQPRNFDETSLEIGQKFQNSYERYKYDSEILVRNFAYRGGNSFIYRTGNVTGQSQTGKFQLNAKDNRWVQCLKGIVALGQVPRSYNDRIVLSAVDIVARGLVAISLDASISSGTFHLDSEHAIPVQTFVEAFEHFGAQFERVNCLSLEQLFRQSGRLNNKDIAISHFWLARGERNIHFNHTRTHKHLRRHGIEFGELNSEWVNKFIKHLVSNNIIELYRINEGFCIDEKNSNISGTVS